MRFLSVIITIFLLFSTQYNLFSKAKLSPEGKILVQKTNKCGFEKFDKFLLRDTGDETYVGAILKVEVGASETTLEKLGVLVGTKAGDIWTAQIPIFSLERLTKVDFIKYIQVDHPVFPQMSEAKIETGLEDVHAGVGALPEGLAGEGVVVGIIDAGFDYAHPMFHSADMTSYRVKRIWEQKETVDPPDGYDYGNELRNQVAIFDKGFDVDYDSHGTHVAAIAAGSGAGKTEYSGAAPESDIVLVSYKWPKSQTNSTGLSNIVDAIAYIFNYADLVDKPAVANLSVGSSIGPHDGTSLFSQACANLAGAGKAIIVSAGNSGDKKKHVKASFDGLDTVHTFVNISEYSGGEDRVDIWGEEGAVFGVEIALVDTTNGAISEKSGFLYADDDYSLDLSLSGADGKYCAYTISCAFEEFNGKPRILIDFENESTDALLVSVVSDEGEINMWTYYAYSEFEDFGFDYAVEGDFESTINANACGEHVFAAGAYTSRNRWTNIEGKAKKTGYYSDNGEFAPFSSLGPTVDGRIKPDISAPGNIVISSVNSFDQSYQPGGSRRTKLTECYHAEGDDKEYCLVPYAGTSASAPLLAATIALMFEANPELTHNQVKSILRQSAVNDDFTGDIRENGSNSWGYGKLNSYAAVYEAFRLSPVVEQIGGKDGFIAYPNPSGGEFILAADDAYFSGKLTISDAFGKVVFEKNISPQSGKYIEKLDLNSPNGVYFITLQTGASSYFEKIIINK